MGSVRRDTLVMAALAVSAAAVVLLLASRDPFWNGDFLNEGWLPYTRLVHDGFGAFLASSPAYAPFATVVGAPASLLVQALTGGVDRAGHGLTAVFRLTALPGLAALCALGVTLGRQARRPGADPGAWVLVVLLAAASPIAYQALLYGHPEDLLAAAASVGAVLLARGGRVTAAGALLALAIATKQWAILAAGPAALAAPRAGWRAVAIGLAGAAVVLVPFVLARPAMHGSYVEAAQFFHPHQVWWPLGVPATRELIAAGRGTRMAPAWLTPIPHPLIVLLALPACAAWWLRAGRAGRPRHDALALLALLFLARCALDPWNLVYYQLPLVLALLAWEAPRGRGLPALTLAATAATWLSFVTYDARTGWGPFLGYFAWAAPLAILLAVRLFAPARPERAPWAATLGRRCAGPNSGARPSSPSTSTT